MFMFDISYKQMYYMYLILQYFHAYTEINNLSYFTCATLDLKNS